MAHLFKPTYTRAVPADATPFQLKGRAAVRWKGRAGRLRTALVCESDPARCLVESSAWWIEYRDRDGKRCTVKASPDRAVSEKMLADLVVRVEQQKAGMIPSAGVRADTPLSLLAEEYREHLQATGRKPSHYEMVHARIVRIITGCEVGTFAALTPERVSRYLAGLRDAQGGIRVQTTNHYTAAVKAFTRWLAERFDSRDPLARLRKLNAEADRERFRRVLSAGELAKLLDVTRSHCGSTNPRHRERFTGPERWALYLTAAYTGLRASELASLTPESFDLEGRTVTVSAAYAKGKRTDTLPIPRDVASQLSPWLATRPPGCRLWPGTWARDKKASIMLRRDLERAGIAYTTSDGTVDFHALRVWYVTSLALAGVHPAKAQRLARHTDIRLTMGVYTRLGLHDLAAEVDRLSCGGPCQNDNPIITYSGQEPKSA